MRIVGTTRLLLLISLLAGAGCTLYNQADRIALETLGGDGHSFDGEVYEAAIGTRFPPGTPLGEVEAYVEGLGGTCHPDGEGPGAQWCEIPVKGGICWAELIGLLIHTESGAVTRIDVTTGGLSC